MDVMQGGMHEPYVVLRIYQGIAASKMGPSQQDEERSTTYPGGSKDAKCSPLVGYWCKLHFLPRVERWRLK